MANDQQSTLGNLVKHRDKPVRIPVANLVADDYIRSAAISKMVTPANQGRRTFDKKNEESTLPLQDIQVISELNKSRIIDLENMVKLFPDLEMVIQIITSLIQAPKDMTNNTLIYKVNNDFFPPQVATSLIESIKKTIEDYHKIPEGNNQLLRESIFETGSYVSAILPESVIDHVINSGKDISTESLKELSDDPKGNVLRGLGFLGNPDDAETKVSFESFYNRGIQSKVQESPMVDDGFNLGGTVTDNYNVLKLPLVLEHARRQKIKENIRKSSTIFRSKDGTGRRMISAESSTKKLSISELEQVLYKRGDTTMSTFVNIPGPDDVKRRSIGRPLRLKLPSESVCPVHLPGAEEKHLGYFVLIDEEGNAVNAGSLSNQNTQNLSNMAVNDVTGPSSNSPMASNLLTRAKRNIQGTERQPLLREVTQIYSSIFEKNLLQRLKRGIYGDKCEIGNVEEVSRIMLSRALSNKTTRVLFIPEELVTYYAFKHHPNGVGKSALDDMRILAGLRAAHLMAKIVAQAKNAIGTKKVNITFDEDDPHVEKSAEKIKHEILRLNQTYLPVGYTNHEDIAEWLSRTGVMFSYKNHPDFPDMDIDIESVSGLHEIPDEETDEQLRRMMYMGFGISPEIVDDGFAGDFVAQSVMSNALMNKRIMQYQSRFSELLTDECRKLLIHDAVAMNDILSILSENKNTILKNVEESILAEYTGREDELLQQLAFEFIESLDVTVPSPESRTLESQKEAFDKFVECIDATIDFWISNDCIPQELIGDTNQKADYYLGAYKAYLIRNWMADNNFLPEIAEIATKDKDGKPSIQLIEMITSHAQSVASSMLKAEKDAQPYKAAADKDLEGIMNPSEDPGQANPNEGGQENQNPNQDQDSDQDQATDPSTPTTADSFGL